MHPDALIVQGLQSHLSSKTDGNQFEDACRGLLGANSYVLFTLQKLVTKVLRSVQQIVTVRPPRPARSFCIFMQTRIRLFTACVHVHLFAHACGMPLQPEHAG